MNKDFIEICGVTPPSQFPICPAGYPSTQVCEHDNLCIPCQKPDMETAIQVVVNVTVCNHKVICTPLGKKLVISAIKHIKLLYVADEPTQSVHSAHFEIPICFFILLGDICEEVADVKIVVEDIMCQVIDKRCISLTILIFACPLLRPKHGHHYCNGECVTYNPCQPQNGCTNFCHGSHQEQGCISQGGCKHNRTPVAPTASAYQPNGKTMCAKSVQGSKPVYPNVID